MRTNPTNNTAPNNAPVEIVQMEVVHWSESVSVEVTDPETGQRERRVEPRHPILIYGLGKNGVVYELWGGKWYAYPITAETMHEKQRTQTRS